MQRHVANSIDGLPDNATIGIFGAGHLGRAVACGLLHAGFPRRQLTICLRGSRETQQRLVEEGIATCVADGAVVGAASILLYCVRPQDYRSLTAYTFREDALLISFLAGIPLAKIPAPLRESQRVRVMPSAPDTIRQQRGIAALYPAGNATIQALLTALSLRVFPLQHEESMHAFTAFGPCLPIALMYWEGLGYQVDEHELLATAAQYALPDFPALLAWARSVQPQSLSADERTRLVQQAATPGGVTEAILRAMDRGERLSQALACGVLRSRELGLVD